METLFSSLTHALQGNLLIALVAAFVWGILSVLLSPCHLSSIPLIVGFISEQGDLSIRRAFAISTLFSTGILVTIAAIGCITAAMGQMLGRVGSWSNYLVALVFLLVGLHLINIIPSPFSGPGNVSMKRHGLLAAFLLGLIFGVALGPCTFAFMAPVLAVSFKEGARHFAFPVTLLTAYGIGHCLVIVAAGTFTEIVEHYLNWNRNAKGASIIQMIKYGCGVLMLMGCLYMIYVA